MIELPKYLQSKIQPEPNTGCWLWTAGTQRGYGRVQLPGTRTVRKAHNVVYSLLRGGVPEGLILDHLCRVRCCVNPEHLEPVLQVVNTMRGESPAAKNALKALCHNGHSLEGTYVPRRGRQCRTCYLAYQLRYNRQQRIR